MLSILIPTYNYNITKLVKALHKQATALEIEFEIIVMEDGSTKLIETNAKVTKLSHCKHIILPKNVGRAAIRNLLAREAAFEHMLFLDCDAAMYSPNFLNKYLIFCHEDCVVLGGRVYDENNHDPNYSLLRKYGQAKERNNLTNAVSRLKNPMFTTPNFLISKSIFNQVGFDESIVGYGHEDTIFGIKLQELGITFSYIDNPVIHVGIEPNDVFVEKTAESVLNLYKLYTSGKYPLLQKNSKLLRMFIRLQKYHLVKLVYLKYLFLKPIIVRHLTGKNPSLAVYDLYKLMLLCKYHVSADKLTA